MSESKVKSIFDSFPSLFSIKRDAIDEYPLWRDEERSEYSDYICNRILRGFIDWQKAAYPYLIHCERKAQEYDRLKESS